MNYDDILKFAQTNGTGLLGKTPEKEISNNKIVMAFDATELDNFELCDFRWHMFHHKHIRPKQTESPLEKGSLLHFFMEHYYKIKKDFGGINPAQLEEVIEKGRIESVKYNIEYEEVNEIVFQVREYARYYEDENLIPLHIEEPFLVKIHEDDEIELYITGLPDLVFKYPHTNEISVMDHKGVRREFAYSSLRNQFMMYAMGIGTDKVIVNKIGFQKSKSVKDRFQRATFIYSDEILSEWKQNIIFRAHQMLIDINSNNFPRNHTSCEKFSGCYLQRYCSTKPKAREFLIGTEYVVGSEWDASRDLEKEKK